MLNRWQDEYSAAGVKIYFREKNLHWKENDNEKEILAS